MSFRVRSRHKARHGPCNTEINFVVLHRFIYHCSQYIVSVFFHSIIFTFLSVPISFPLRLPRYQSISLFVSFYLSLSLSPSLSLGINLSLYLSPSICPSLSPSLSLGNNLALSFAPSIYWICPSLFPLSIWLSPPSPIVTPLSLSSLPFYPSGSYLSVCPLSLSKGSTPRIVL